MEFPLSFSGSFCYDLYTMFNFRLSKRTAIARPKVTVGIFDEYFTHLLTNKETLKIGLIQDLHEHIQGVIRDYSQVKNEILSRSIELKNLLLDSITFYFFLFA